MKELGIGELKKFNGRDGNRAYVTYDGLIYDVTASFLWKDGKHQVIHYAGRDLSEELENAPHGIEFLKRFPVIGRLKENF
ncbi:MAG: cytochrome b5 domain-containing protein [Actinomycetota bacterium]